MVGNRGCYGVSAQGNSTIARQGHIDARHKRATVSDASRTEYFHRNICTPRTVNRKEDGDRQSSVRYRGNTFKTQAVALN